MLADSFIKGAESAGHQVTQFSIIDRFYATNFRPVPVSSAVLLTTLEEEDSHANVLVDNYHIIINALGWKDKGVVVAGLVKDKGDIAGNPALLKAEKTGKNL